MKKYKYFLLDAGDAFYELTNGAMPDAVVDVNTAKAMLWGGRRRDAFFISIPGASRAPCLHGGLVGRRCATKPLHRFAELVRL